jgi:ketosteroid isomerase-like protein
VKYRSGLVEVAMVLFLAGCGQGTNAPPTKPPVDWRSFATPAVSSSPPAAHNGAPNDLAGAYLAALATPDLATLATQLAPDSRCSFPGMRGANGRRHVIDMHQLLFAAFADRKFYATRILQTGTAEVVQWTMAGRQERDWMQVAVTHRVVELRGATLLWATSGGQIADIHVYFDVASVKAQLGAVRKEHDDVGAPAPGPAPEKLVASRSAVEMQNVATERRLLDDLEAGDQSDYLSCMTDDVALFTLQQTAPSTGTVPARQYYEIMRRSIAQLDTTISSVWGIQSFVAVEYTISGQQLGPIESVPPVRDRVLTLHIVDVSQLRDGQIERVWRYDNPGEIAADL